MIFPNWFGRLSRSSIYDRGRGGYMMMKKAKKRGGRYTHVSGHVDMVGDLFVT